MSSFFERNTTLKIISIVIALILWATAPNNRDPLRDISLRDIPLKIDGQHILSENGLMVSSILPDTYNFDIRSKGSTVRNLDKSKITAVMDLAEITKTGEQDIQIEINGLPSNIEIKTDTKITINVEKIISKIVSVMPKASDKDRVELGKRYYEINPQFIEIRGPESIIRTVAYAQVMVPSGNKDAKIERSLAVELLNEDDDILDSELVSIEPEYCVITVLPNKVVRVEAVITGKPADGFVVVGKEVMPGEVTVSGDPEILDATEFVQTEIMDVQGAKKDLVREVNLRLQEDIKLSPGQASSVQILVRIEEIIDRQISFDGIDLRNIPEDLSAQAEEIGEKITITLRGPKNLVNSYKPEDLKIYTDLGNTSRGKRSYPILVDNLPSGLEITQIEPESINVIIK
ncbi:MAG: hypothetical protein GX352_06550 [Clostridiales bacterium]|nr:hypothetical protein [Clostridiales bacterium]